MTRKRRRLPKQQQLPKRSFALAPGATPSHAPPHITDPSALSKRTILIGTLLSTLIVVIGGLAFQYIGDGWSSASAFVTAPTFVGSETCAKCHQKEAALWRTSQHKHAMAHATDQSVLGDFSNASFDYHGVRSRFFRKDGKFFVETDGADGKLATFEIKYTFGISPLQQYLVGFPDGRLQALSIAWDSRTKENGGQRWFHLYPHEVIRHDDILHWTKLNQNWNYMCAECHSTGVRKNYDTAHDRFATHFVEISVGCEACHGQGSRHVAWAREQRRWWPFGKHDDPAKGLLVRFDERKGVIWSSDPATGLPRRSVVPAFLRKEVETCGLCHARRGEFSENWIPGQWLSDTHHVALLSHRLFYADGQMRDVEETYNYAAFKQSKMFAKGVTCSDCHDPHSAALRAPGDGVCLQCHAAGKYEAAAHSHHVDVTPSVSCISCHMPAHTYMVIDRRHDHSFRIPRPDLSVTLGTPNACNACHADKSAKWAAAAIERWFGPHRERFQTYAAAFHAAWTDQPDAGKLLAAVISDSRAPGFIRASAFDEMSAHVSHPNKDLARRGLSDPDPMVRIGALDMLERASAAQFWPLVAPLLSDPVRGVRIKAAALLASVLAENQPPSDRESFKRAAAEFVAAQRLNADRPEARAALGGFYAQLGLPAQAQTEFITALHLSPQFAPAAINLADLYRQLRQDDKGAEVLKTAISASPRDAGLHHALGLALVRLKRNDEALVELQSAAKLDPDQARYAYVYAVALHSAGRAQEAIAVLKDNLARHPNDLDTLAALVGINREIGDIKSALEYAQRLAELAPANKELSVLVEMLRHQVASSGR